MLTTAKLNAEQAKSYFEHGRDYYTKNQSNHDRWHGSLASTYGLIGEVSKEAFDMLLDHVEKSGRTTAAVDCTFSAPKSVSLALAAGENVRSDMISAHQAAVSKILVQMELDLTKTRRGKGGIKEIRTMNFAAAEFLHTMARPSDEKSIPDLDLHSHCVMANMTVANGTESALDYREFLSNRTIMEYGLRYREQLAFELRQKGYEIEVTDPKKGFFELKGFDRETVMDYSSRRREILQVVQTYGIDTQTANLYTRNTKGELSFEDLCDTTKKALFDTGKIRIERSVSNEDFDRPRTDGDYEQLRLHEAISRQRGFADFNEDRADGFDRHPFGGGGLPFVSNFHVGGERSGHENGTPLLLSSCSIDRLAKLQAASVFRAVMLRETRRTGRERVARIDTLAAQTLQDMSRETYAFTATEATRRLRCAGITDSITADEAAAALARAGAVDLGQLERDGEPTAERYITTEQNIVKERRIIDRVQEGKARITQGLLSINESRAALDRVEQTARMEGRTDFTITDREGGSGEQAEAVHHILTSADRYICVSGLAGTGKTASMQRLKWIADEANITLRGLSFTGKAAAGLQADSEIGSMTIHSFLSRLERESQPHPPHHAAPPPQGQDGIKQTWDFSHVTPADRREIWVCDEAGLVDMHLMDALQTAAEARGAQLVLLGDPQQLPPVGAGEPMRQIMDAGASTAHLSDIRRQKNALLLRAVQESVSGDHLLTYERLDAMGAYHEIADTATRRAAITEQMTAAPLADYSRSLLLVSTNTERRVYNAAIRAEFVSRGEVEQGQTYKIVVHNGDKIDHENRNFAIGDRIIFTANNKKVGVMNGEMATIEGIEGNIFSVKTDGGKKISFNIADYASVDHAYAVTNYKSQGMTVQNVIVDMNTKGASQTRNALYVDISRAKMQATIYTDDKEKLERQTRDFAKKITSEDFAKKIEEMREHGITGNDRYKPPQTDISRQRDMLLAESERQRQEAVRLARIRHTAPPPPPQERTTAPPKPDEPPKERQPEISFFR